MLLSSFVLDFCVLIAWCFQYVVTLPFIWKSGFVRRYNECLWHSLGIIGISLAGWKVLNVFIHFINGYIFEYFAFEEMIFGKLYLIHHLLEIIILLFFGMNIFNGIRQNKVLKTIQLIYLILVVGVGFLISNDFATSVIPGWHTTINPSNNILLISLAGLVLFFVNVGIIKLKKDVL